VRGWQNYRSFLGVTFNIQYSVSIDRCLRAAPSFERNIFNSFLKVQTHTSQIEEEDDEKDIE
jgi:hypothetical protein